jgi:hypothetical protein
MLPEVLSITGRLNMKVSSLIISAFRVIRGFLNGIYIDLDLEIPFLVSVV